MKAQRGKSSSVLSAILLFLTSPATYGFATNSCIPKLQSISITNDTGSTWANVPPRILGLNTECEAGFSGVEYSGWNELGLRLCAHIRSPGAIAFNRVTYYIDTRSPEDRGRYPNSRGIFHITVRPSKGTVPLVDVVDYGGRLLGYKIEVSKKGDLGDQTFDICVPWTLLGVKPELGLELGFEVAAYGRGPDGVEEIIGAVPPDPWNNPETDPATFDIVKLVGPEVGVPSIQLEVADAELNGLPCLSVKIATDKENLRAPDRVNLGGTEFQIPGWSLSISGKFRFIDWVVPLTYAMCARELSWELYTGKEVLKSGRLPLIAPRLYWAWKTAKSADGLQNELLAEYLRGAELEAILSGCTEFEPTLVRQKQLRLDRDPHYFDGLLEILNLNLESLKATNRHYLGCYWKIWQSADKSLQLVRTVPALDDKQGSADIRFHFLDGGNKEFAVWKEILDIANNEAPMRSGESWKINLFGRGNSFDLYASEEMSTVMKIVGDRSIILSGHSAGADDALKYALEYPFVASGLDLRAGAFVWRRGWESDHCSAAALRKAGDSYESEFMNKLYPELINIEGVRNVYVRLAVGELDVRCLRGSQRMASILKAAGARVDLVTIANVGHDFAFKDIGSVMKRSFEDGFTPVKTANLDHSRNQFLQIEDIDSFGSEANMLCQVRNGTIYVNTQGVTSIKLLASEHVLENNHIQQVEINGTNVAIGKIFDSGRWINWKGSDGWKCEQDGGPERLLRKSCEFHGPMEDIKRHLFLIVGGTGRLDEKPYVAYRIRKIIQALRGNRRGQAEGATYKVIDDTEVLEHAREGASFWLVGHPAKGTRFEKDLEALGVAADSDGITLGTRKIIGADLLLTGLKAVEVNGKAEYLYFELPTEQRALLGPILPEPKYDFSISKVDGYGNHTIVRGFCDMNWRWCDKSLFTYDD